MASQQRRKNSNVRVRHPRAAASVHGATFCASRQNAGSYPNSKHSETRTQTPFMFISMWLKTCEVRRYRVNNKVKHELPSLLLINSPITYSRLLPRPPAPPILLIGSPSCPSAFATPDWLALPAPLAPRALKRQLGPIAARLVSKGREEQEEEKGAVAEGQTDRNGGKEAEFLRTNCHIWPLCIWRGKNYNWADLVGGFIRIDVFYFL